MLLGITCHLYSLRGGKLLLLMCIEKHLTLLSVLVHIVNVICGDHMELCAPILLVSPGIIARCKDINLGLERTPCVILDAMDDEALKTFYSAKVRRTSLSPNKGSLFVPQ